MGQQMRTRLQVERKNFVDLYQDISIPVTKSLADIRDLSKRSGGYTTSIEVPATKSNMNLFGHLYDLNITNGTFDTRRKYTCVVIKDDVHIFQGYIKLDSFNKYEGPDGETIITFNISLMDNISNFFGKIKDKYLNPDENVTNNNNIFNNNNGSFDYKNNIFWDDLYVPKYNYTNIISTFENTFEDKWKFYLPSQTKGYYETTDFKPGIFLYEYLNRIIEGVGYSWNGSKNTELMLQGATLFFITVPNTISTAVAGLDWRVYGVAVGDYIQFYDYAGSVTPNKLEYKILTMNGAGTEITVDGTLTAITSLLLGFTVKRKTFIDLDNWNLLNKTINLDKLIVPYAGGKDVIKDLNGYNVYGTSDLNYYNNFKGWTFTNSTAKLNIGWGVTADTVSNIGDIIQLKHNGGYVYFEVLSKDGSPASGQWDYTVQSVDSNWIYITNIASTFDFDEIKVYYVNKYYVHYNVIGFQKINLYHPTVTDNFSLITYSAVTYENNPFYNQLIQGLNRQNQPGANLKQTIYTASKSGNLQVNVRIPYDILINSDSDAWLYNNGIHIFDYFCFVFNLVVYKNGVKQDSFCKNNLIYNKYFPKINDTDAGAVKINANVNIFQSAVFNEIINIPIVKGDVIKIELEIADRQFDAGGESGSAYIMWRKIGGTIYDEANTQYVIRCKETQDISYTLTGFYAEDDENMKIKDFIPKKVKQSDFLIGLCKMFNLFIDYDESKRQLLILPRDQYYTLGKKVDLTQSIDISNKNNVLFNPELQYKNYIYTYKADGDTYNKAYTDNTKQTYGAISINFDNDLLVGTTTIDNIFTSTPIARIGGNIQIPPNATTTLEKFDGNLLSIIDYSSNVGLKILYDAGLITDTKSSPFLFRVKTAESALLTLPTGQTYADTTHIDADPTAGTPYYRLGYTFYKYKDAFGRYKYPYIGHLDLPTAPANDLNYAINNYYFFNDIPIVVQNNLFYKHWERTIRQQSNGKLLKGKFYLTSEQVKNLKFNDLIYVMDAYWYLNKIVYNAQATNDIYELELISVI